MITIITDWCKGCGLCIKRCPRDALEESDEMNRRGVYPPKLKEDNDCNNCRLCELICPDFAVTVIPENDQEKKKSQNKLVIGGTSNEI